MLEFVADLLLTKYASLDFVAREISINNSGKPLSVQRLKNKLQEDNLLFKFDTGILSEFVVHQHLVTQV